MIGAVPESRRSPKVFVPKYTAQTNGLRADTEMNAN
jgi:hypothetical protein